MRLLVICCLLRLSSLLCVLYLASLHRETTERTPKELRINSAPQKSTFLKNYSAICLDHGDLPPCILCTPFVFLRTPLLASLSISPASHAAPHLSPLNCRHKVPFSKLALCAPFSRSVLSGGSLSILHPLPVTPFHLVCPFALPRRDTEPIPNG